MAWCPFKWTGGGEGVSPAQGRGQVHRYIKPAYFYLHLSLALSGSPISPFYVILSSFKAQPCIELYNSSSKAPLVGEPFKIAVSATASGE